MTTLSTNVNDKINDTIKDVTNIPKDKTPREGKLGGDLALNTGLVQLYAVINRKCPFKRTADFNDVLVFNSQSVQGYPSSLLKKITTVAGAEGVFLKPKIVYRHNFVAGISLDKEGVKKVQNISTPEQIFADARKSIYRFDQSWIIRNPIMYPEQVLLPEDYNKRTEERTTECSELAKWQYKTESKSKGQKSEDTPEDAVLFPEQITGATCSPEGVHWKLQKATDVFRGEDFFVEYQATAGRPNLPRVDTDNRPPIKFENRYESLNVNSSVKSPLGTVCDRTVYKYHNLGVIDVDPETNKPINKERFDFRDQAYFMIEIGISHPDHNYLLIINERSAPRLVRIDGGLSGGGVSESYVISEFDGAFNTVLNTDNRATETRNLMAQPWFRVEWRNHLGDFIITFDTPSGRSSPWIISRIDLIDNDRPPDSDIKISVSQKQQPVLMYVPRGKMALHGGNHKCAFSFGPIEYEQPSYQSINTEDSNVSDEDFENLTEDGKLLFLAEKNTKDQIAALLKNKVIREGVTFTVPPLTYEQRLADRCKQATGSSTTNRTKQADTKDNIRIVKRNDRVSLPTESLHSLRLSSNDYKQLSLVRFDNKVENQRTSGGFGNSRIEAENQNITQKLYTQDAQKFFYLERNDATAEDDGTFFLKAPLKEPSYGDNGEHLSSIKVKKDSVIIDEARRVDNFRVVVELKAGNHVFESGWVCPNCKTPVLTTIRLVAESNNEPRWKAQPIDVSEHVLEYSDSWSAQDYTKIEHTADIKFLITEGASYDNDQTEALLSLVNKAFYIEIWAGYASVGQINSDKAPRIFNSNNDCNYSKLDGFYKLFTGVCYGGSVSKQVGKRVMDCQIFDYSRVLEDMRFFNSPFYDGVRAFNAVHDIFKLAGFLDTDEEDPGRLLKIFAESSEDVFYGKGADGRTVFSSNYTLPSSYARLQQPYFKFNDGDDFYNSILKIAQRGGKCFFFDSHGVGHFDSYFDFSVVPVITGVQGETLSQRCTGNNAIDKIDSRVDELTTFWYTSNPNFYSGQMVYNSITASRSVRDVYNHVKIMSNTPDFTPIILDDFSWDSLFEPTQSGFIGYLKTLYQREPAFGSREAATNIINFYRTMRKAPLKLKFETFGQPLRALDIIRFDGQPARVMKVDTTINPSENLWWNSLDCEWLYPTNVSVEQSNCPPAGTT